MSGLMRTRWAAIGAAVAVTLGAGGISLTHAVVDSGVKNVYVPINPCRLADTRPAPDTVGPRNTPLPSGTAVTFDAFGTNGNCTLPSSFSGLMINVTPVNATANTDIRLYPAGGTIPTSSNLNPEGGTLPVPNLVAVGVNNAGQFSALNKFGTVNIVIDVLGYFDDHNHDDRYPTKTLTAVVETSGAGADLVRGVGATSATRISTGFYGVTFDQDVSDCTWIATQGRAGNATVGPYFATTRRGPNVNEARVVIFNTSDTQVDTNGFHLAVICEPG